MEQLKRANGAIWCLLAVVVGATGCAALRAAAAKQQYIHNHTQDHVYAKPLAEVWPTARQMLFEANYEVKDTGEAGQFTLETEWLDKNSGRSRYLVQGIKVDETTSKVQFTRVSTDGGSSSTRSARDLDMEWALLQRIEPGKASEIETAATADGNKSR